MALEGRILSVECPCPGTPHEADTVQFRAVLPLAGGIAAISAMRRAIVGGKVDNLALAEEVFPIYLAHAVESWTFVDAEGQPLALTAGDANLPFGTKYEIADAADDLFGEEVTRPLLGMIQRSSQGGPTGPSTSRNRGSGRSRRSRSVPSSPNGSEALRQ